MKNIFLLDNVYFGRFVGWVKEYFNGIMSIISKNRKINIIPYHKEVPLHFQRVLILPITTNIRNPFFSQFELNVVRSQMYKLHNLCTKIVNKVSILIPIRIGKREILNLDQLINSLKVSTAKVSIADFGEITFQQQLLLIHNASVLISSHGAQLVNIIFMRPKSYVIELMNPYYYKSCYPNIAITASLHHISVRSESIIKISKSSNCPKPLNPQPYIDCNYSIVISNFSKVINPVISSII